MATVRTSPFVSALSLFKRPISLSGSYSSTDVEKETVSFDFGGVSHLSTVGRTC